MTAGTADCREHKVNVPSRAGLAIIKSERLSVLDDWRLYAVADSQAGPHRGRAC
jgi:hypothetical protein